MKRVSAVAFAMVLAVVAAACGSSSTSPTTVSSIAINGTAPGVGASAQFTAIATMSNGTTQDVTGLSAWTSSNTGAASVSSTGLVIGIGAGTTTVTATYLSVTGTDPITIPAS
jgi:Big-like domain-containing protein